MSKDSLRGLAAAVDFLESFGRHLHALEAAPSANTNSKRSTSETPESRANPGASRVSVLVDAGAESPRATICSPIAYVRSAGASAPASDTSELRCKPRTSRRLRNRTGRVQSDDDHRSASSGRAFRRGAGVPRAPVREPPRGEPGGEDLGRPGRPGTRPGSGPGAAREDGPRRVRSRGGGGLGERRRPHPGRVPGAVHLLFLPRGASRRGRGLRAGPRDRHPGTGQEGAGFRNDRAPRRPWQARRLLRPRRDRLQEREAGPRLQARLPGRIRNAGRRCARKCPGALRQGPAVWLRARPLHREGRRDAQGTGRDLHLGDAPEADPGSGGPIRHAPGDARRSGSETGDSHARTT